VARLGRVAALGVGSWVVVGGVGSGWKIRERGVICDGDGGFKIEWVVLALFACGEAFHVVNCCIVKVRASLAITTTTETVTI
jgi:hypothetical protein